VSAIFNKLSSGLFVIRDKVLPGVNIIYEVTSNVNQSGYTELNVTYKTTNGSMTLSDGVSYNINPDITGAGVSTFLGLSDTPGSYATKKHQIPIVNTAENALSFSVPDNNIRYVSSAGSNTNTGKNPWDMYDTFTNALSDIVTLESPSDTNRFVIVCENADDYTESISVPQYVSIWAPNAKLIGTLTLADDAEATFKEIRTSGGDCVLKSAGTGTSKVNADIIRATSNARGIRNTATSGVLIVHARQIFVENGFGVGDNASADGHIHLNVDDIYITGTGTGISRFGSGTTIGYVHHILKTGAGTGTALLCRNGEIILQTHIIDTAVYFTTTLAGAVIKVHGLAYSPSGTSVRVPGSDVTLNLIDGGNQGLAVYVDRISGDDNNGGRSPEDAVASFTQAAAIIAAVPPSSSVRYSIFAHGGETYTESFTIPDYTTVIAPGVTLIGQITHGDNSHLIIRRIETSGSAHCLSHSGSALSFFQVEEMVNTGTGNCLNLPGG